MSDVYTSLIDVAHSFVGVREKGGNNKGPEIEMFQRFVDGKAQGEPYCCAFVEYCIGQACEKHGVPFPIRKTEHCLTLWNAVPDRRRHMAPSPGFLMVWQKKGTSSGHIGIVVDVAFGPSFVVTIEGNTGPEPGAVQREGDGVYVRTRSLWPKPTDSMQLLGFIDPFGLKSGLTKPV